MKKLRLTSFQIIIFGFAGVILLGAFLLMLPVSSAQGVFTGFEDALFTATSATCVTGLVVQDTGSYWSAFGHTVIIVLIQIGGLGVVTVAASFAMLSGKKISLKQRSTMQEAISAPSVGGIVRLTGFVLKMTAVFELAGGVLLLYPFVRDYGLRGVPMAFFHSVSAFCNAGFDILGTGDAQFGSLTGYAGDIFVNVPIMLLIIIGGIGFLTWEDVAHHGLRLKKYKMQSKVILVMTAALLTVPAVLFFFRDFRELPMRERILASLFQSVTARTAGFNTADLDLLTPAGLVLYSVLMLIGGAPGSTAGGLKTTTAAVLLSNMVATFRRREDVQFFGRRIESGTVKNAATILMMYVTLLLVGAVGINIADGVPLYQCIFEAASAVGTVGLTLGITPGLSAFSQGVLIVLMFLGRVGGLTLIFAASSGQKKNLSSLPQEKITVG